MSMHMHACIWADSFRQKKCQNVGHALTAVFSRICFPICQTNSAMPHLMPPALCCNNNYYHAVGASIYTRYHIAHGHVFTRLHHPRKQDSFFLILGKKWR